MVNTHRDVDNGFGAGLLERLSELVRWKRGEIALEVINKIIESDPETVERAARAT
jgi:hypothetical protein